MLSFIINSTCFHAESTLHIKTMKMIRTNLISQTLSFSVTTYFQSVRKDGFYMATCFGHEMLATICRHRYAFVLNSRRFARVLVVVPNCYYSYRTSCLISLLHVSRRRFLTRIRFVNWLMPDLILPRSQFCYLTISYRRRYFSWNRRSGDVKWHVPKPVGNFESIRTGN